MSVEGQVDLKEAEHDPTKVMKAMHDLSKEPSIREYHRRSTRWSCKPLHTVGGKSDNGSAQSAQTKSSEIPYKGRDSDNGVRHVGWGHNVRTNRGSSFDLCESRLFPSVSTLQRVGRSGGEKASSEITETAAWRRGIGQDQWTG